MPEPVILCVDDDSIILLALRNGLRHRLVDGYRLETALGGESALDILAGLEPSEKRLVVVVSDWRMPGMSGDELLRKVRTSWPAAKLILLTGYAEREQVQALDAEISLAATFQKPCDIAALASTIQVLVAD
jgi:CheY-like chemotaxis protein